MKKGRNIFPFKTQVSNTDRNKLLNQQPFLLWFTGLSGSGKSTIATNLELQLFEKGYLTYLLDGDNVRSGINKGLGFSEADRKENIRRMAEVSKLMLDTGVVVLSAFVSPLKENRDLVREIVGEEYFLEVFVNCALEVCEQRDTKGLYKQARAGLIKNFTGIGAPFEKPTNPFIELHTDNMPIETGVNQLLDKLYSRDLIVQGRKSKAESVFA